MTANQAFFLRKVLFIFSRTGKKRIEVIEFILLYPIYSIYILRIRECVKFHLKPLEKDIERSSFGNF